MQQLFENGKWVIGAIAVVALLGGALFGATIAGASGDTNDRSAGSGGDSGEPVTVIERTVVVKEEDDDQEANQGAGQGSAQAQLSLLGTTRNTGNRGATRSNSASGASLVTGMCALAFVARFR
jgi:hypothetical protein